MNTNIYNPYVRRELELYHHGVLGQKWGQRNGPPYPLFAGAHSASEKKAGWRKSLNKSSSARYGGAGQSNREARKYQRKLNQLDKNQAEHLARYQRASDKAARIERKHGNTSKKYQKAIDKAAAYERSLKNSEAVTWKTIAELTDKGYSMNSEKVKRYALMGETMVGTLLGGFLGGTLVTGINSRYINQDGNKFNVRKTDPSEQQSTRMELGTHDGVKATIETSTKPSNTNRSNSSNAKNESQAYKDFKAESDEYFKKTPVERIEMDDKAEEDIYKNDAKARALRAKDEKLEAKYYKQWENPHVSYETLSKTRDQWDKAIEANYNYLMKKRIENMVNSGASHSEIAKRLGMGESKVSYYLNS